MSPLLIAMMHFFSRPRNYHPLKSPAVALAVLCALSPLAGCDLAPRPSSAPTPTAPASHGGPVVDQPSLLDELRRQGLNVMPESNIEQPFLSVEGDTIKVENETIQVFEYPDEGAANADASKISPNGTISGMSITWTGKPHFYRSARIIVIYVGNDPKVLGALDAAMGKPFAIGP